MLKLCSFVFFIALALPALHASHPVPENPLWLTYEGGVGPGEGQHIVLIAADQEYRSEQVMPMLAEVLSKRHGFHCTGDQRACLLF